MNIFWIFCSPVFLIWYTACVRAFVSSGPCHAAAPSPCVANQVWQEGLPSSHLDWMQATNEMAILIFLLWKSWGSSPITTDCYLIIQRCKAELIDIDDNRKIGGTVTISIHLIMNSWYLNNLIIFRPFAVVNLVFPGHIWLGIQPINTITHTHMPQCDIHCSENIINTVIKSQEDLLALSHPLVSD